MSKRLLTVAVGGAIVCVAIVGAPAEAVPGRTSVTSPGSDTAYYSNRHSAPQSKSPAAMRKFLSTDQKEFGLQSYCFFGSLTESNGKTNTFSLMMQQNNDVDDLPTLSYAVEGVMFNGDDGFVVGGIQGVPELTVPLSLTATPWSARSELFRLGQSPQFIDARVVEGRMGEVGAVYEFTAKVTGRNVDTNGTSPLSVYIRAKDLTGIVQWGYGPSGFFPQWIYPDQRAAIMRNGGSVEKYLARSGDPMKGQGDYYYSSPLLQVQEFVVTSNDGKVSRGRGGTIWFDNVTQSFGEKAKAVVDSGVSWLEFSLQLPNTGQALKIGHVTQQATGNLPYAVMVDGDGAKARNGTILPTSRWDISDVVVTPVRSSLWTSPKTGEKYYMKYKVRLKGATASTSADLVVTAAFKNQEVVLGSSRTVYEGLFDFTGAVNGAKVDGTGWAEIQPAKSL